MAFVPRRPVLVALIALPGVLAACSSGDNDDNSGAEPPITSVSADSTSEDTTGTTPTTEPATASDGTTSTTAMTSSTTEEPTTEAPTTEAPTTAAPTTDPTDGSGSDDTGPICDPGMPNCVCDDGACIAGYVCQMNVCSEGLVCPGDIEPADESEDSPVELGNISDDDDDFLEQGGVLSGASDVDWFRLHGADTFGHVVEPTLTITVGAQRGCLFLECDEGGAALTDVTCPGGSEFAISPQLRPGCCGSASFSVTEIGCPGQDDSMQVWLRLDKPAADACADYDVQIHF